MKRIVTGILFAVLFPLYASAQTSIETRFVSVTAVVDLAANTAGDNVGGLLTFPLACNPARSNTAEIRNVIIRDNDKQSADMAVWVFNALPATTFATNTAFAPSNADLLKVDTVIPVTTHLVASTNSVSEATTQAYSVRCTAAGTLYAAMRTTSTPTYTNASSISVMLVLVQD